MKQNSSRALRLGRQITFALASATRTGVMLAGIGMVDAERSRAYSRNSHDPRCGCLGCHGHTHEYGHKPDDDSVSDGSGIYTFNGLPPDRFSVKAVAQGFQTTSIAEVVLITGAGQRAEHQDADRRRNTAGRGFRIGRTVARYGYGDGERYDKQRGNPAFSLV